mmetsp:Transcript_10208/g.37934  ORF Transcript_10208/g.37934 Transcript_10208/m.37934 type:complete len:209 (+) Transcript_10208:1797-2423(+)
MEILLARHLPPHCKMIATQAMRSLHQKRLSFTPLIALSSVIDGHSASRILTKNHGRLRNSLIGNLLNVRNSSKKRFDSRSNRRPNCRSSNNSASRWNLTCSKLMKPWPNSRPKRRRWRKPKSAKKCSKNPLASMNVSWMRKNLELTSFRSSCYMPVKNVRMQRDVCVRSTSAILQRSNHAQRARSNNSLNKRILWSNSCRTNKKLSRS